MPDLVSKAELIKILNERLKCLPEGKDATVSDLIRLRHVDPAGCNWMPDFSSTTSAVALLEVFATARHEFILKEEPLTDTRNNSARGGLVADSSKPNVSVPDQ